MIFAFVITFVYGAFVMYVVLSVVGMRRQNTKEPTPSASANSAMDAIALLKRARHSAHNGYRDNGLVDLIDEYVAQQHQWR